MPQPVGCVIMAGGRGARLWPMVHSEMPKVCATVNGTHTLLDETLARVAPWWKQGHGLIVTTQSLAAPIRRSLSPAVRRKLLVEPQPRNTAACIALAASVLAERDPQMVMVVLPADHWMKPASTFRRNVHAAVDAARASGRIVTIGLKPARPHSGLGYLCAGAAREIRRGCRTFELTRVVEKPTAAVAAQLIRQGRTYWNTGIFIGRAQTFLDVIARWLPAHAKLIHPLGRLAGRASFAREAAAVYRKLTPVSFDHGVMAHLREGEIIEGTFAWEDLGSWDSWIRISRHVKPALEVASRNVHVMTTNGHLVATVGLDDVVVVQTSDATLVCRTKDAQAVYDVVAHLERDPRLARYL
ncbi:MAG: hypothetical protein HYY15_04145 [Candidatus Omnitrophica bacterium]|nr:hypothetical protein [Candidatus Omnitrophota bacterium]